MTEDVNVLFLSAASSSGILTDCVGFDIPRLSRDVAFSRNSCLVKHSLASEMLVLGRCLIIETIAMFRLMRIM